MNEFVIRYNARTSHIQGVAIRTKVTGNGEDNGSGVVGYYAQSACPSLTKGASRMAVGKTFTDLGEALGNARISASVNGRKLCKHCEKAAERALDAAETEAPAPAPVDAARDFTKITPGTDVQVYLTDGSTLAGVFQGVGTTGITVVPNLGGPNHGKRITRSLDRIESFEYYVHDLEGDDEGGWLFSKEGAPADLITKTEAAWDEAEAAFQAAAAQSDLAAIQAADEAVRATWTAYRDACKAAGQCIERGCTEVTAPGSNRCGGHGLVVPTDTESPATTSRVDGLRVRPRNGGNIHDGFRTSSGTWTTCGVGGNVAAAGWGELSGPGARPTVTCKKCLGKLAEAEANRVHALAVEARRRLAQLRIAKATLSRVNEELEPMRWKNASAAVEDAHEAYCRACEATGQCWEVDCDAAAHEGETMCPAHVIVYGRGAEVGLSLSSPPVPIQAASLGLVHHGYHNGLGALRALCEANDAAPAKSYWRKLDTGTAVTCSRCAALVH